MPVKYQKLVVGVQFREKVHGGVPLHTKTADFWMDNLSLTDAQRQELAETIERLQNQIAEEATNEEQQEIQKALVGFLSDDVGLYVKDITWKAHLRDTLSRLGIFTRSKGKNEVHVGLQIRPERIRFMRDGNIIKQPDELDVGIVHINTPQGRRSALRYGHVIVEPTMEFAIFLLCPFTRVKVKDIEQAFTAGQEYGYGANRTIGYGRYKVTKFESQGKVEVALGQELTFESEPEAGQEVDQEADQATSQEEAQPVQA